jgi:hypothetical protein
MTKFICSKQVDHFKPVLKEANILFTVHVPQQVRHGEKTRLSTHSKPKGDHGMELIMGRKQE